jgi:hypothetical protein
MHITYIGLDGRKQKFIIILNTEKKWENNIEENLTETHCRLQTES